MSIDDPPADPDLNRPDAISRKLHHIACRRADLVPYPQTGRHDQQGLPCPADDFGGRLSGCNPPQCERALILGLRDIDPEERPGRSESDRHGGSTGRRRLQVSNLRGAIRRAGKLTKPIEEPGT